MYIYLNLSLIIDFKFIEFEDYCDKERVKCI